MTAPPAPGTISSKAPNKAPNKAPSSAPNNALCISGLLALTLVRLLVAAWAPLSADEAYYWVWSKALATGYPDHPPLVALVIRVGTWLAGDTSLGVRLAGPLLAAAGSVLLARAAEDLYPGRHAGIVAVGLLNATLVMGAGAVIMTPDTPLLFFWTATVAAMARLIRTGQPAWWLAVGVAGGLALDSKYTAVLLGAAIAAWLLAVPDARRYFRTWQLWAGAALAAALFAPVLAWNASHGWVSFLRQGGRTGDWHPGDALRFLGELAGGQIGLATPFVFLLFAAAMLPLARNAWRREPASVLVAAVTLLPAAVFVQHAFGGRVQANWPAIIYPGAALAAAAAPSRYWRPAAALGLAIALLVYAQAALAPLSLPRKLDFTLIRLAGWDSLTQAANGEALRQNASFIAADGYGLASQLAFRLPTYSTSQVPAEGAGRVIATEPRWLMMALPDAGLARQRGLLVRSARDGGAPDGRIWADITPLGTIERGRAGVVAERYFLYGVTARPDSHGRLLP